MKVSLSLRIGSNETLEVHEASPAEIAELQSLFLLAAPGRMKAPAFDGSLIATARLVDIGRALGIPDQSLLERQEASIPLHLGIRQVAESTTRLLLFHRERSSRWEPIVNAAIACAKGKTYLDEHDATWIALKKAVGDYESAEKEGDSNASPSAEGSNASPSNQGDSNASPSAVRTVCSGCDAEVEGGVGAMLPAGHRCDATNRGFVPVIVAARSY